MPPLCPGIEAGLLSPTQRFAAACDEAFPQMGGWFTRFYDDSRQWDGPYPRWFADWVDAEARATVIRWWEPLLIPGLLQTEDYAPAVLSTWRRDSADEVEAKIAIRLGRQSVLASADFRALLDESVLHRRIGARGHGDAA